MEEKNLLEIQDLVIRFHTDDGVIRGCQRHFALAEGR